MDRYVESTHRGTRRWDHRLISARNSGETPTIDLDSWRHAVDPYGVGAWQRRLSWGGLGGPRRESHPAAACSQSVRWAIDLANPTSHRRRPENTSHDAGIPFAHALIPLVDRPWEYVRAAANSAGLTAPAQADLRRALLHRLSDVATLPLMRRFTGERTLVDVALDCLVSERRPGSSTVAYERFCADQSTSGFRKLLQDFPVLERLLATVIDNWVTSSVEFLTRLRGDRNEIESIFGIRREVPITALTTGLSDPHRGGRGVVVLTIGEATRLVYKPRPVEIERRFQELVAELDAALSSQSYHRLTVLPLRDYGYVEHVSWNVAESDASLTRFYGNAGRLLAILYLLGATDCHWENLIAAGGRIALVDAETLLEGTPAAPVQDPARVEKSVVAESIGTSVLRTGMLPTWIPVGAARSIDISALGAPSSMEADEPRPTWCFTNTDDMVWGERLVTPVQPTCLPVEVGTPNPLSAHTGPLIAGFEEAYAALMRPQVRDRVRACLETFRGVRRRVVVRPTRTYVLIQKEALDADALGDPDLRAVRLERLTRAYTGTETEPRTWPLLLHEIAALEDLDVPYFESVVGERDLFVDDDVVVDGYYETDGLDDALDRLSGLSDADCQWQTRLIRGSIAAHRFEMGPETEPTDSTELGHAERSGELDANAVADLLVAEALEDPAGPPTWLTVALLADATRVQLGLIPPGLYDGRAGIAAFLYDCGRHELADAVLEPVSERLDDGDRSAVRRYLSGVGLGLSGIGGVLRLFRYRAEEDGAESSWRERTARVIAALSEDVIEAEPATDLLSGIAGLAAPIAAFHRYAPSVTSERLLRTVGRSIIDRQHDDGGWLLAPGQPALLGLSHGASGIAVALAEIATALGDERFVAAASRAVRFEASRYDAEARNWPDLRRGLKQSDRLAMRSWCHGSVGVALSRIRLLELLDGQGDSSDWRTQLTLAVEGSLGGPLTPVDHLCCGNMGRALVLMLAGQVTGDDEWKACGVRLATTVAARAERRPDRFRLLLGIDGTSGLRLPGLMTGITGIGMSLHHGADTRWVRSLLL